MRTLLAALVFSVLLPLPALGQSLSLNTTSALQEVLTSNRGKQVTVRLSGGQELTGTVRSTTQTMLTLGALTGREFFDAAIPLDKIEAVIMRVK